VRWANTGLAARVKKSEGRVCKRLKAMSEESALLGRRSAKGRKYAAEEVQPFELLLIYII
jgi:hypothetical protein